MRAPRRPELPAKQRYSPGSGPAGPLLDPNHEPSGAVHGWEEGAGSGVRDTQTWVSRTKRTLRRRGYFPSLESSPPAGGISPKTKQRFRRCGGEFLSERSERNQRIAGAVAFGKDLRLTPWSFMSHFPPVPLFYGGSGGVRGQSYPARCHQEGCLIVITAVLLS